MAVLVNEPVTKTKVYKHWTPEFAVRHPELAAPIYDISSLLDDMPSGITEADNPLVANRVQKYQLNKNLCFSIPPSAQGNAVTGLSYLTYGWGNPESSFTWSICEDAGLIFPLENKPEGDLLLSLALMPYRSPLHPHAIVDVLVNDIKVEMLRYDNQREDGIITERILLPFAIIRQTGDIKISFVLPARRQAQFEAGKDIRSLGIALISAKLSAI